MTLVFNRGADLLKRRELRHNETTPENIIWFYIRDRRLKGIKFRRQYSVGAYVVDFYCATKKLAIEIDGDSHFTDEAEEYDRQRTDYLEAIGITVIRFTNMEVMKNIKGILKNIVEFVSSSP